jgi:hypothetical protein
MHFARDTKEEFRDTQNAYINKDQFQGPIPKGQFFLLQRVRWPDREGGGRLKEGFEVLGRLERWPSPWGRYERLEKYVKFPPKHDFQ